MSKEFIIKKNIFGGFDRRQVIDYLAHLQSQRAEPGVQYEIEVTRNRIKSLLEKIEEKDRKIRILNEELESIENFNSTSAQTDGFESLSEADKIIENAKNEAKKYINETKQTVKNNNEQFDKIMSRISSLNEEIAVIGTNADKISSEIVNLADEDDDDYSTEAEASAYIPEISESPDTFEEDIIEFVLPETDEEISDDADSFNYIDNFFSELEKLTGSADYYEGQDISTCYDRPNKTNSGGNNAKNDEAFDDLLKNIIKGTPQT